MPAVALPELIEPGELYVPDGLGAPLSTAPGAMPNGDNAAQIEQMAGVEDFMAYQPSIAAGTASRAPHLLTDAACALSFWIRRNQNFDSASAGIGTSVSTTPIQSSNRFIMGVVDPLTVSLPAPADRRISWAFVTYGTTQIQFLMSGFWNNSNYYWSGHGPQTLPTGEWTLIVVNRDAADFSSNPSLSPKGGQTIYVNGNQSSVANNSLWKLYPNPLNDQRFCIGDGTALARTAGGAAPGPAWDIAKVCFHDRQLSTGDQLDLVESMRYGPTS